MNDEAAKAIPFPDQDGTTVTILSRDDRVPVRNNASTQILELVTALARDPQSSPDRIERFLKIYDDREAKAAKAEFYADFSACQGRLPSIDKNGKITITDKVDRAKIIQSTPYALWADINEAIKPVLLEYGFGLTFKVEYSKDEAGATRIGTRAILLHRGGHEEETTVWLPLDATGSKNNVQAQGSSLSYGKRMAGCAILNITAHDKGEQDDDGGRAGGPARLDEDQVGELQSIMVRIGGIPQWAPAFFEYLSKLFRTVISSVEEIPAAGFETAKKALLKKEGQSASSSGGK